ncbi:hypothetical protein K435DRAFT_786600, partial [Dendrothele bispora CBS 962.96]
TKTLDFRFISGVSVYNMRSLMMLSSLSDHENKTLLIFSSHTLGWSRSVVKVCYTY